MYLLKDLLIKTIELGASDLHLTVALPPTIRVNGKFSQTGSEKLLPDYIETFAKEILNDNYDEYVPKFKKILPNDYAKMMQTMYAMEEKGMTPEQAKIEAFYINTRK